MKVWIHISGVQEGPYELDQLPMDRITPQTPVWYEGLAEWMPAGEAPLTARLFEPQAEGSADTFAPAAQVADDPEPKCPPTYMAWSILLTIICCNPLGIVPIVTGASTRSKFNQRNFSGAKRMSTVTEWWIMILIVTSLMMMPLSMLMHL